MIEPQKVVATTPAPPLVVFRNFLEQRTGEFKTALPDHITPDKFIRTILTAATINPEIIACDRRSLAIATMRAANDGLLPDGQEGAIVPFKGKAQWIPMYQGLLKRFRNSGQFEWISAGIVYDGEEFDHWIDEFGEHFKHRPGDDRDPSAIRRVYAIARTKDGGKFIADLSLREVEKHRAQSRATREDGPWNVWREEMMKKTALRVLSKLLPKSSDIEQLMREDEAELYGVEKATPQPESVVPPSDTAAALDAFGADASQEPQAERPLDSVPEGGEVQSHAADDAESPPQSAPAGDHLPNPLELQIATDQGKSDRRLRKKRDDLPEHYRQSAELTKAWQAGWDKGK